MSDDRSPAAATDETDAVDGAETDGGSSDSLEPGGGPRRVVSNQSVDDILDSLDATNAESADSSDGTGPPSEPSDAGTTAPGEDDVSAVHEGGGATADETTTDDTPPPADESATASDAASVDAAASSLPDDASLEDLAARIDDGTVTGADVRAAEAGEGRESTPEIDEVDLSMADLETGRAGVGGTGDDTDVSADAGPLAGSVDSDADGETNDDSADSDEAGLLGRLKRFFSR